MDPNSSDKDRGNAVKQIALAFQTPFTLVVPAFVAGGIGYLLDRWLHTKFILMIVLGFIGFGIGLWNVLKSANAAEKEDGE